ARLEGRVITLVRRVALKVLNLRIQEDLLARPELVLVEFLIHAEALNLLAEIQVPDDERGDLGEPRIGSPQVRARLGRAASGVRRAVRIEQRAGPIELLRPKVLLRGRKAGDRPDRVVAAAG